MPGENGEIRKKNTAAMKEGEYAVQGAAVSHKGLVRKKNEDNFCFQKKIVAPEDRSLLSHEENGCIYIRTHEEKGDFACCSGLCRDSVQIYAVCDGMGGIDLGEEASYLAVSTLASKEWRHWQMEKPEKISSVLREISGRIYDNASRKKKKSGTTIAMILIKNGKAVLVNVGDSRIYRFREEKLTQLSADDSRVQKMVAMGIMTPEEARTSPRRHIITQYLGMIPDTPFFPHIVSDEELQGNDIYLLCSDGLTDMVEDHEIEAVLRESPEVEDAAITLLTIALKHGGRDNVTLLLLHVKNLLANLG